MTLTKYSLFVIIFKIHTVFSVLYPAYFKIVSRKCRTADNIGVKGQADFQDKIRDVFPGSMYLGTRFDLPC